MINTNYILELLLYFEIYCGVLWKSIFTVIFLRNYTKSVWDINQFLNPKTLALNIKNFIVLDKLQELLINFNINTLIFLEGKLVDINIIDNNKKNKFQEVFFIEGQLLDINMEAANRILDENKISHEILMEKINNIDLNIIQFGEDKVSNKNNYQKKIQDYFHVDKLNLQENIENNNYINNQYKKNSMINNDYKNTYDQIILENPVKLSFIIDKNYNILEFDENIFSFFDIPKNSDIHNLKNLFHIMIDRQILPENKDQFFCDNILEKILNEEEVNLITLNDKSYVFLSQKQENNNYLIIVKEITQQFNNKLDLYNNYQLINYLVQSLDKPIIVFNRLKLIEFTNHKAEEMFSKEILDGKVCIKEFLNILKENFNLHGENFNNDTNNLMINMESNKNYLVFHHENCNYKILSQSIGDFTCLIIEELNEPAIMEELIKSLQKSIINNVSLIENISNVNDNVMNCVEQNIISKISHNVNLKAQKINDYLAVFQKNQLSSNNIIFINLFNYFKTQFNNKNNITLKANVDPYFSIVDIGEYTEKFITWLIEDMKGLCQNIAIDFKSVKNKGYIQIQLIKTNESLKRYREKILNNLKIVHEHLMKKNNSLFNLIINDKNNTIQLTFWEKKKAIHC